MSRPTARFVHPDDREGMEVVGAHPGPLNLLVTDCSTPQDESRETSLAPRAKERCVNGQP